MIGQKAFRPENSPARTFDTKKPGFFTVSADCNRSIFGKKTRFRVTHASKTRKKENALFSPPATPKEAQSQNSSPPSYRDRTTMQTKILLINLTQLAQKKTRDVKSRPFWRVLQSSAVSPL